MSKLILKRFQCVIDTDELGSESPYFLTFVGDIGSGKTTLKMTRQGNWENEVDKGEIWTVNETVAEGFALVPAKTLVLSAMVEEDEGLDVNGNEMTMIHNVLIAKLNGFRQAGATIVNSAIAGPMASAFKSVLGLALFSTTGAADDYMGTKRVALSGNVGDLPVVSFVGDGGRYNVRYAVA